MLFAIAAFPVAGFVAAAFALTWLPEAIEDYYEGFYRREGFVAWIALAGGLAGCLYAGWAWRSPKPKRFHYCFWAGLSLLCLDLAYIRHISNMRVTEERYDVWAAPLVSSVVAALGLILLLTALILDRASPTASSGVQVPGPIPKSPAED